MAEKIIFLAEGNKISGPNTWKNGLIAHIRKTGTDAEEIDALNFKSLSKIPKLLHARTLHSYSINGLNMLFMILAKLLNRKIVFTVHGDVFAEKQSKKGLKRLLWIPLYKITFSLANTITYPSEFTKEKITNQFKNVRDKSAVIYNGIDIPRKKAIHRVNKVKNVICITNFNYPDKTRGVDTLVKVASKFDDEFKIKILGDGKLFDEYKKRYQSNNIIFLGRQPINNYLTNADLLIHPTYLDNLPYVILEAVSSSVPVIAFKIGGIPEMLCDISLVDPDAEALYRKFKLISENRLDLSEMVSKNNKILKKFDWNLVATKYAEIY
jgi:glycosyltransferase involved in cell wall biosynthesis